MENESDARELLKSVGVTFKQLGEHMASVSKELQKRMLDNMGLKINVSEMPESKMVYRYSQFLYGTNWITRIYKKVYWFFNPSFYKKTLENLEYHRTKLLQAVLNATIKAGEKLINPLPEMELDEDGNYIGGEKEFTPPKNVGQSYNGTGKAGGK